MFEPEAISSKPELEVVQSQTASRFARRAQLEALSLVANLEWQRRIGSPL